MLLPLADIFGPIEIDDAIVAAFDAGLAITEAPTASDVVRSMYAALSDAYDSVDREALFVRGAAFLGVDYGVIYDAWMAHG